MGTNRIEQQFADRKAEGRGALLPYVTAGFPDMNVTEALVRRADAMGVTAIELGIPYSDSIADGPVIQSSFYEALHRGFRLQHAFDLVSRIRADVQCGLIAMVSYSVVHRIGLDDFMRRAGEAGFDGVILPDVPVEESLPMKAAADSAGLCHIGLIAPTTEALRREAIAKSSTGFIYQIAVTGTTGERNELPRALPEEVSRLRQISGLPVCVGFGISRPEHVRTVCDVADGAIVGSAIVRHIADALQNGHGPDKIVDAVSQFISDLLAGLDTPSA